MSADSETESVKCKLISLPFIVPLQVYLCFQRVAAEILGIKLNKAEIEQSQVRHDYYLLQILLQHLQKHSPAFYTDILRITQTVGRRQNCKI